MSKYKNEDSKHQQGFTLVELAIVLLITGLALGMLAQFIQIYSAQTKRDNTIDNIKMAQSALYEFYALNGRYPCPADPSLSEDDAEYGLEHCRDTTQPGCVADGVVCTNVNSGDAQADGNEDFVMIGALPTRTILEDLSVSLGLTTVPIESTPFRRYQAFDSFGMNLTYAVSQQLADSTTSDVLNPANPNLGAIRLISENNVDLTTPPASAQYVIVSHGDNSEGAYNTNGIRMSGCSVLSLDGFTPAPPGPSPAGNASEKENCDYDDAIFVKGARSLEDGDSYFDDILGFKPSGRAQLWIKVPSGQQGQSYIRNNNLGNVGVGAANPAETLHVAGDISAEKSTYAAGYCEQDGTECIDPEDIAGTGFKCPAGTVARGVFDEDEDLDSDNDAQTGTDDDRIVLDCIPVFQNVPVGLSCTEGAGYAIQSMTYDAAGTTTLNCIEINP